jgi:hypothetical protein
VPAVWPDSANRARAVLDGTEFRQEASDFLALESAITPTGYAICSYSSAAAPPPQGVGMDMEELGYFPDRHQFIYMFTISHIFSDLVCD